MFLNSRSRSGGSCACGRIAGLAGHWLPLFITHHVRWASLCVFRLPDSPQSFPRKEDCEFTRQLAEFYARPLRRMWILLSFLFFLPFIPIPFSLGWTHILISIFRSVEDLFFTYLDAFCAVMLDAHIYLQCSPAGPLLPASAIGGSFPGCQGNRGGWPPSRAG